MGKSKRKRRETSALKKSRVAARIPQSEPAEPSRYLSVPYYLLLSLGIVVTGMLVFREAGSLDTGFHLRGGDYILTNHSWPDTDPFSFTYSDHQYIDTSWGFQVVLTIMHNNFSVPGVVVFNVLIVLSTFLVLYKTARLTPVDPYVMTVLLAAGFLACEIRFEIRPELVSYMFLSLVLYLLHRYRLKGNSPLWLLPVIHLIWANTHALFMLGWIVMIIFNIRQLLDKAKRVDRKLLLWTAISIVAGIVNPYGLKGLLFPFTLLTRFNEQNVFAQSIGEFVSPLTLNLSARYPFFPQLPVYIFRFLLLASFISLWRLIKQKRYISILLWVAFLPLSLKMIRNIPLFVIGFIPLMIQGFPAVSKWNLFNLKTRFLKPVRVVVFVLTCIVFVGLGIRIYTNAYYIENRRMQRWGWSWNRWTLPVDAVRYAQRANIQGHMLNHLNFGGYLMYALHKPVLIDGRLEVVGEEFYEYYKKLLTYPEMLEHAVSKYDIQWIIFPYADNPRLLNQLSKDTNWILAYYDHLAVIFVRNNTGAESYVDPGISGIDKTGNFAQKISQLPGFGKNARPDWFTRWIQGLYKKQDFPVDEYYRGLFHYYLGELDAAENLFISAIEKSDGKYYEIYHNLGAVLYKKKEWANASQCYRIVLDDDPANKLARKRLSEMR